MLFSPLLFREKIEFISHTSDSTGLCLVKILLADLHYSVLCVALTVVWLQNICWQQWMILYKSHSGTHFRAKKMYVVLNIHLVCFFLKAIKCFIWYIKETVHTDVPMVGNCLPMRSKHHCIILLFYSFVLCRINLFGKTWE